MQANSLCWLMLTVWCNVYTLLFSFVILKYFSNFCLKEIPKLWIFYTLHLIFINACRQIIAYSVLIYFLYCHIVAFHSFGSMLSTRSPLLVCVDALLMESLPGVTDSFCHLSLSHCLCAALFVWECCQQLFLTSLNRITSNRELDVLDFNIVVELKVFTFKCMKFSFFPDSVTIFPRLHSSLENL